MNDMTFTIDSQPTDGRPIAAFDYDGTLVRARDGRTHAQNVGDWRWMRPSVPATLVNVAKTHRIFVITDQSKPWKIEQIKTVTESLRVPVTVIVGGKTKKPNTDWVVTCLGAKAHDMRQHSSVHSGEKPAFYVGDAAGRPGDWSDCDRVFAENMAIPFHVADQYFPIPDPIPRVVPTDAQGAGKAVIMVGYPGSGKSTVARYLVASGTHCRIDGDVFATPTAMIREAKRSVAAGATSVVFDSTGGTVARRKLFVDWVASVGLEPVIVWVATDIDTAMDWNASRAAPVPAIAFFVYRKHFVVPTEAEGAQIFVI
jgi:bifunctional polynucleotide phosphatase/kinase